MVKPKYNFKKDFFTTTKKTKQNPPTFSRIINSFQNYLSSAKTSCIFFILQKNQTLQSHLFPISCSPASSLKRCISCQRYLHHSKRTWNRVDIFPIQPRVCKLLWWRTACVKMKINQWRNVRRPLSFSLHPSRVWKWSVVENLPALCVRCDVMTALTDVHAPLFHTTTLHSPVRLQEYFCKGLALSFDSQRYLWTVTNKTWEKCVFITN